MIYAIVKVEIYAIFLYKYDLKTSSDFNKSEAQISALLRVLPVDCHRKCPLIW